MAKVPWKWKPQGTTKNITLGLGRARDAGLFRSRRRSASFHFDEKLDTI
jgi:hypothetical protein